MHFYVLELHAALLMTVLQQPDSTADQEKTIQIQSVAWLDVLQRFDDLVHLFAFQNALQTRKMLSDKNWHYHRT